MNLRKALRILPRCYGRNSLLKHRGFIFLYSHMRAYTSLLGHLIGSHPDVCGYAEMHQKLRGPLDLLELTARVEDSAAKGVAGRRVFDKILHDHPVHQKILDRDDVTALVAVREPRATIASILEIGASNIRDVETAAAYYRARLDGLRQLIARRRGRALFLDAEAVVENPGETLASLSRYLDLDPPIAARYQIFPHTGRPKYGDPSANILAGEILTERPAKTVVVPDDARLASVRAAYEEFRADAMRSCEALILAGSASGRRPGLVSA